LLREIGACERLHSEMYSLRFHIPLCLDHHHDMSPPTFLAFLHQSDQIRSIKMFGLPIRSTVLYMTMDGDNITMLLMMMVMMTMMEMTMRNSSNSLSMSGGTLHTLVLPGSLLSSHCHSSSTVVRGHRPWDLCHQHPNGQLGDL
jgi:hypothetical protein